MVGCKVTGDEYAVLLSCASEKVNPELVERERFPTALAAQDAFRGVRQHGLDFAVVHRHGTGDWHNRSGLTPVEIIRLKWAGRSPAIPGVVGSRW